MGLFSCIFSLIRKSQSFQIYGLSRKFHFIVNMSLKVEEEASWHKERKNKAEMQTNIRMHVQSRI